MPGWMEHVETAFLCHMQLSEFHSTSDYLCDLRTHGFQLTPG